MSLLLLLSVICLSSEVGARLNIVEDWAGVAGRVVEWGRGFALMSRGIIWMEERGCSFGYTISTA